VASVPSFLELRGPAVVDVLVGGEEAAGGGVVAEEPARVAFGGDAQADALFRVLDRGEAEDLAGAVNALTCQMEAGSTSAPSIRQMMRSSTCTPTRSGASSSTWLGSKPAPARSTISP
jgi:hypothetical protein